MATIDIKLKTYEQLQFEIIKLNTDIVLKNKEIERLNHECDTYLKIATKRKNIIDELEKLIDSYELGKYDYEIPVVILKERLKELIGDKDE